MTINVHKPSNRPVKARHQMNPKTEDLIRGDKLENGMIVLIADSITGSTSEKKPKPGSYDYDRYMKTRYWCEVTDLKRTGGYESNIITFVGVYANGVKRAHTYNEAFYWFVKVYPV